MAKAFKILFVAVVFCFVAFSLSALYVFQHSVSIPVPFVEGLVAECAPASLVVKLDGFAFGIRSGVIVDGLRVFEAESYDADSTTNVPIVSVDHLVVNFLSRRVLAVGVNYPSLPASYYAPENHERNGRLEATLPELPNFLLTVKDSDILGVRPACVLAEVEVCPKCVSFERIHLDWSPEPGEKALSLEGSCRIDLEAQEVVGEVHGDALQKQVRPLIVKLDIPVALPYIDDFTEVPKPVPASCSWHVNLINNDFTMDLGLHPTLGKYRTVPMAKADGNLHLFVYTRGDWLNYRHQFGPIVGVGPKGEPLEGTVFVEGTNGTNTVSVVAKSALPVAHLLMIGGFDGDYADDSVFGDSECSLKFNFPRTMTNNYEVMNGKGSVSVKNGRLMRMKGLRGLVELLAERVPGVSWFTDATQGSCDYVIENGILRSDNIYIEGSVFSIKMYGQFDTTRSALDFTVRVQFTKHDSVVGKLLHPLTWPFTKLLLEFRLTGSPENPNWKYVSVIDRVLEAVK